MPSSLRYPGGKAKLAPFIKRVFEGKLLGPLGVVPFVEDIDAGFLELQAIELLHGLEFDEAASGDIGTDDVLGELRVGPGCGAEGGFKRSTKNVRRPNLICVSVEHALRDSKDGTVPFMFLQHPVDEPLEGQYAHSV